MKRNTINISRPEPQKTIDEIEEREKQITYQKHQGRLDYISAVERVVGTINRRIVHFGAYRKPIGNPNATADNEQTTKGLQKVYKSIYDARSPLLADPRCGHLVEQAKRDEIAKLQQRQVYEEIDRSEVPENKDIIGTRYVYTVDESEKKANGKVKARCVAQGFRQKIGREDTYSPVVLTEGIMAFIICATVKKMTTFPLPTCTVHSLNRFT